MSAPMAKDRLGRLRKHAEADQMTNGCWVRELLADRDHWEKQVQELLAVIHGDGGHHSERVGIAQSLADAHDALPTLRAELTEITGERDTWEKLYGERDAAYKASCDDAQRLWSVLVRIENESPETREWFDEAYPEEWYATDPEEGDQ